ncbi:4Fe-4S dicluster domain-containing protein [Anaerocolumna sp. MB42-C2]|uniref:4Fe-4S dicluster domain-containing protein n=1 Tax=Anaerocolumna sp. MB42-C2 TaxID=3070997 RepID=UPI0027E0343D|nr:4Fe-4S dicluster domain-containing protein [Anaerocolumna sp. MB42-C2]WMJ85254.1 4Fe-4S dicluster domain-containing protein [Anaerocolumna sp. MB42-C2]
MLGVNTNIDTIKQEVLYEVAKLAFNGELDEKKEALPYELIPGPQANFRCCIYKEREIIRQRIRLAEGKSPSAGSDNKNVVQVINSACEGCPITRFVVTDNCQKCMGKRCQEACNFEAITMLRDRAYIDPNLCKECGKCSQACPYNAIADLMRPCKRSCPVDAICMDENNIVVINEEKCIDCGNCIKNCPFGAISDRSFLVDVIELIRRPDIPVYAMLAPAWEGQFGAEITTAGMAEALKGIGFEGMYEVALGADLVAANEALEWAEAYNDGKKMTTSCCPAFVKMIRKHYPKLETNISTTVSPMTATARLIKTLHPGAVCVFIGPCIAKKGEVLDTVALKGADYALTLEELYAMFRAKDVEPMETEENLQQGSIYGKKFCVSGGVTTSVIKSLKENGSETELSVRVCNGAADCKKALMLLKAGKLPENFIEGMVCESGCSGGPGSILTGRPASANRDKLFAKADNREINKNVKLYENLEFYMHK